ncbi:hypothetical protein MPSEU_000823200 [Mayamaea pseudoterrestris]|nr:hypothetical protein MPSEU_000823200 [Mayamaea pseudoterrestris]
MMNHRGHHRSALLLLLFGLLALTKSVAAGSTCACSTGDSSKEAATTASTLKASTQDKRRASNKNITSTITSTTAAHASDAITEAFDALDAAEVRVKQFVDHLFAMARMAWNHAKTLQTSVNNASQTAYETAKPILVIIWPMLLFAGGYGTCCYVSQPTVSEQDKQKRFFRVVFLVTFAVLLWLSYMTEYWAGDFMEVCFEVASRPLAMLLVAYVLADAWAYHGSDRSITMKACNAMLVASYCVVSFVGNGGDICPSTMFDKPLPIVLWNNSGFLVALCYSLVLQFIYTAPINAIVINAWLSARFTRNVKLCLLCLLVLGGSWEVIIHVGPWLMEQPTTFRFLIFNKPMAMIVLAAQVVDMYLLLCARRKNRNLKAAKREAVHHVSKCYVCASLGVFKYASHFHSMKLDELFAEPAHVFAFWIMCTLFMQALLEMLEFVGVFFRNALHRSIIGWIARRTVAFGRSRIVSQCLGALTLLCHAILDAGIGICNIYRLAIGAMHRGCRWLVALMRHAVQAIAIWTLDILKDAEMEEAPQLAAMERGKSQAIVACESREIVLYNPDQYNVFGFQ